MSGSPAVASATALWGAAGAAACGGGWGRRVGCSLVRGPQQGWGGWAALGGGGAPAVVAEDGVGEDEDGQDEDAKGEGGADV